MRSFFNRAFFVYEIGSLIMLLGMATVLTWPDPFKALRLGGWLFLLIQPFLLLGLVVDHFSRRRRR